MSPFAIDCRKCRLLCGTQPSLENHGADSEVDSMFEMGEEVMDLPIEEKMRSRDILLGDSYIGAFG